MVCYVTTTVTIDSDSSSSTQSEANLRSFSPTSPLSYFHPNDDLEICYDARTRTPVYALERLRRVEQHTNNRGRRRRPPFVEESRLPVVQRSRNQHYQSSGYDRGHMAPAADYHNTKEAKDTFTLTNVCPQVPRLNRGLWNHLEQWVRRQVQKADEKEQLYVVTGPLWLPNARTGDDQWEYQYPALGQAPSLISVPTHFFKLVVAVVCDEEHGNQIMTISKYAAFVVPNREDLTSQRPETYLVRWTDLEAVVGMQFFPSITSRGRDEQQWRAFADAATDCARESVSANHPLTHLMDGRQSKRAVGSTGATVKHFCLGGVCK